MGNKLSIDLSIIIVNWNSKDFVKACIESIRSFTHTINYEIIVVDSASYDGCDNMLASSFPDVRYIQSETNIGFARANNLGSGYTHADTLLFLNPDTEIKSNSIDCLYQHFKNQDKPGVVGSKLLNGDGTLQTSCIQPFPTLINQLLDSDYFLTKFPNIKIWMSATTFEDREGPVSVEVISGACMMLSKAVFEQVGKFSTDYFMYGEDLDLCYKVKKSGFQNLYFPDVEITHFGGGSTQGKRSSLSIATMKESVYLLLKKSHGAYYSAAYKTAMTLSALLRMTMLLLVLPMAIIKKRFTNWQNSFNKWNVVFLWGIGLQAAKKS